MNKKTEVEFLGKKLVSPLVLPAGVMDLSFSGMRYAFENGVGMVTTKSYTIHPRKGHNGPVVATFENGLLNSMGLCNPGIDEGIKEVEQLKIIISKPVIISIFGTDTEEFIHLTKKANTSKADFIELNLSCPNVADEFGTPLAASSVKVYEIVSAVKKIAAKPIIAKLSPNVYDIQKIAKTVKDAQADAITMINTLGPGMLIDIRMRKPVLHNKFGGMSGGCVKPIAIKLIYQVSQVVNIPIIGMGGVQSGEDAIEFIMAGAKLVGVGTAVYNRGINVFEKINNEIIEFMEEENYSNLKQIKLLEKERG